MTYSKNWLYKKYITEYMTQQEIADIVGVNRRTIGNWLTKYNISRRGQGGSDNKANYRNKDWLYQKYVVEKKSLRAIGKMCNRDWSNLRYILISYGIKIRKRGETITGKDCHFWKGGKYLSRGYNYIVLRNTKGKIYNSEHRVVAEKCLGRKLTSKEVIHHINRIKTDNRPENLFLFPNQRKHQSYHQQMKNGLVPKYLKSNLQ